jgi:hypothetical protein
MSTRELTRRIRRLEHVQNTGQVRFIVSPVPLEPDEEGDNHRTAVDEPYPELTVEQWKARYCHDSTLH